MRLRLDLAYEGTGFHGWAAQPGLRTVQGTLEAALMQVLRRDAVPVTCAGRTDSGVHARGQVVHLDIDADVLTASGGRGAAAGRRSDEDSLLRRLNGVLPPDVRVRRAAQAHPGFDARFSALWRRYAYRIADGAHLVDPLARRAVLSRPRPLDLAAMNLAASALAGEHDFGAFCKKREGASTVRTLLQLSWARDGNGLAVASVKADAFCHNMVRALVGCLLAVGEGRREPTWPREVLAAGVRDPASAVVPAHGLTLEEVAYPPDDALTARAEATRVLRSLPAATSD